jgi:GTP-binding protein
MKFVDEARIEVRAGDGGPGLVSFRRERRLPKGGPDGGDGGAGGDVIVVADGRMTTLWDVVLTRRFAAERGRPGGPNNRTGRRGQDCLVRLPVGTLVFDLDAPETDQLLVDLDAPGRQQTVARGGRGGKGNRHFVSSTRRAPKFAQPGEPGEERSLRLELKLLAQVGLVGLPNAGKSTLLAAVSRARPKIAPYPFTTLTPHLGVIRLDEDRSFVMADIPGLIEGAHLGAGLGDRFLRHLARTRLLLHLVDVMDLAGEDPRARTMAVVRELAAHDPELAARPRLLVVTKMDLTGADQTLEAARPALEEAQIYPVSAVTGRGVRELLAAAWDHLERIRTREEEHALERDGSAAH